MVRGKAALLAWDCENLPPFVHPQVSPQGGLIWIGSNIENGLQLRCRLPKPWANDFGAIPGVVPAIFQIIRQKRVWLLGDSFDISEGSGSAPGYSTCPALSVRSHGDRVMSLREVLKGASQGLASPYGRTFARVLFVNLHYNFVTNHGPHSREFGVKGLH
jgi:hypothetical protein